MGNKVIESIDANIPVDLIDHNPDNKKIFSMDDIDSLAGSIKRNGFRGVVEVYQKEDGRYELHAGHRRFEAAKMAGLTHVPAKIYSAPNEIQRREILIDSNIYNRKLTPMNMARAINYHRETLLMGGSDGSKITDQLAAHFGLGRSMVFLYLSILKLIPELQDLYEKDLLTMGSVQSLNNEPEEIQRRVSESLNRMIQSSDSDEKKRLTIAQVDIAIKTVKDAFIREHSQKDETARKPEQYFTPNPGYSPFRDNTIPSPMTDYSDKKSVSEIPKTEKEQAQDAFMQMQNGLNFNVVTSTPKPIPAPIIEEPIEELLEEEVEPIDRAVAQLTIQLQQIARNKIVVDNKNSMVTNIDIMKRAIRTIEENI